MASRFISNTDITFHNFFQQNTQRRKIHPRCTPGRPIDGKNMGDNDVLHVSLSPPTPVVRVGKKII